MSRFTDETQSFDRRLTVIRYVALAVFVVVGARFWTLQIVRHDDLARQADNNRYREIPIPAPRGNVLDRDGRVLVDSRPAFNLTVNREDLKRQTLDDLLGVVETSLGVDRAWARRQIDDPLAPKSRPVVVKQNLSEADRAWVEAHEYEHPELRVEIQPQRLYPLGPVLGHVLGYVGQISKLQLEAELPEFSGAQSGDVVGQAGIERSHNRMLAGVEGKRVVVVDSRGRTVEEVDRIEPVPGQDLVTSIDLDLQSVAEAGLAATNLDGVAIALDPRTGEILALVSHPSYDPNAFAGGISPAAYATLRDDPDRPLTNRAIQDIYPPGSTWKIIMAMAGLSEGAMTPTEGIACGGGIQVGSRFAACHGSHGAPNLERAIAVSCNGYFYRVGMRLGVDKINKWSDLMGIGRKTGVDLPNETPGYIPAADLKLRWKAKGEDPSLPKFRWTDGDTVNASIGQGYDRPTPLQMVHAFAGVAMDGRFRTPHLLRHARSNGVRPDLDFQDPNLVNIPLDPAAFTYVTEGMRQVVTNGTARRAEVPGFDVCGKSGTAQVVSVRSGASGKQKEHAWFVGFAPKPDPKTGREAEIAVCVLVEHGGHGGVESAPIAQAIIAEYVRKYHGAILPDAPGAGAGAATDPDAIPLGGDDASVATDENATPLAPGDDAAPTIVPHARPGVDVPQDGGAPAAPPPLAPRSHPLQGVLRGSPRDANPPSESRRRGSGAP